MYINMYILLHFEVKSTSFWSCADPTTNTVFCIRKFSKPKQTSTKKGTWPWFSSALKSPCKNSGTLEEKKIFTQIVTCACLAPSHSNVDFTRILDCEQSLFSSKLHGEKNGRKIAKQYDRDCNVICKRRSREPCPTPALLTARGFAYHARMLMLISVLPSLYLYEFLSKRETARSL